MHMSLNKSELVSAIAAKSDGLTKAQAEEFLNAFQAVLEDSLSKGEAVKVTGLLSVERVERAARTGRNPRTGEEIQIPAGYGVKISAGSVLKKGEGENDYTGARPELDQETATDLDYVQQALIPKSSETHSGEDVAIYAKGPWAHLVDGTIEQNVIFHVMNHAVNAQ